MATYKVFYKDSTKQIQIAANAASTPTGYVLWGTFVHDDDANDGLHWHGNHCVYNHVRGLAYRNGHQNMQNKTISYNGVTIAPPT